MFLLENQLPYQLLQLLMSSSQIQEELKKSIDDVVWRNSPAAAHQNRQKQRSQPGQDVAIPMEAEPTHLLELLRTTMLGRPSPNNKDTKRSHSFRNVQELRATGIHFSPSDGNSLSSIYFNSSDLFRGILHLPQIKVDDSTRPKFMNLIAYEMWPDFHNDFGVTSYICLLDSLIDHPDDVKYLRKKRILRNLLGIGNDEEVAQLFNEIGTDLVPNNDIYSSVKDKIEDHYDNWGNRVMAQFFHEHFSSPWCGIAFLGALLGVVSSIVQTVNSVLSYHNNK
ncbi:UPF0481 protein At3g47200-like [Prunus avium]|uniref:UPF0481 protein At3g47200-like n=1 Tax=Prunus avium TaxID=42229 RepID=A0A6P5RQZ4_PRUAV|nr:UPF0481 protein At3g47200-like [Prunus avium]